jgi:uncharacterized protein (TIGR03437 family)
MFGEELGPSTLTRAPGFPLPTELAGTSIRIQSAGQEKTAYLVYASAAQLAAVLPSDTPLGRATAVVMREGQLSEACSFTIVRSAFGIYTINSAGSGYGILTNASYRLMTPGFSMRPGETGILWGTGLGPVPFSDADPASVQDVVDDVEVLVGGRPAVVRYKGRAPCCAGLDQIVFDVPSETAAGCGVTVAVRTGRVASNFAHMAVAPSESRTCSDPAGFSTADMDLWSSFGRLRVGLMDLRRLVQIVPSAGATLERITDSGSAVFYLQPFSRFISQRAPGISFGSCVVYVYRGLTLGETAPPFGLNGGPGLQVEGPRGMRRIPQSTTNTAVYQGALGGGTLGLPDPTNSQEASLFLVPGEYSLTSSGGVDVGPFTARIRASGALRWISPADPRVIPRDRDLEFRWEGGDTSDLVQPSGLSYSIPHDVTGRFICSARASDRSFRVPAWVLSALPATSSTGADFMPTGSLGLVQSSALNSGRFAATGIDSGFVIHTTSQATPASFQ